MYFFLNNLKRLKALMKVVFLKIESSFLSTLALHRLSFFLHKTLSVFLVYSII